MGIKYCISETRLTGQQTFVGRVLLKETFDQSMLVDRMLSMGTSMTKTDIMAVLNLFVTAVEYICLEGNKITMAEFMQFTPVVRGTFNSLADGFQPNRNQVALTTQVSTVLNTRFNAYATVEKVMVDEQRPRVMQVTDSASTTGALGVGRIIGVVGKRLRFDPAAPGEGLHLVNFENPSEFVPIDHFYKLNDHELVFLLPSMTFTKGYFELTSGLGTTTLRQGRSKVYDLEAV